MQETIASAGSVPQATPADANVSLGRSQSPAARTVRRLLRNRSAQVGLTLLAALVFVAMFADLIAPFDPTKRVPDVKRREGPCIHILGCDPARPQHLMGIDGNTRDLFSRVVFGSRLSLQIGIVTTSAAILIGALLGAIAGYAAGWTDNFIMRFMDVLLAFPSLLLAIAIVTVLGPGLINTLLAVAIVSIPVYARVVRSSVLGIKEMEYIAASQALGSSSVRILFTRVLPNSLTPLIVVGTLGIATAILEAAALSFLGLGAQPPTPEWGLMLGEERNSVFNAPHLVFFPGIAIMITVLAFNLLGDGLRDALDPRRKA
jgi:ABC-type dipeptide/oligopeptide/nickel transport system permease subunit